MKSDIDWNAAREKAIEDGASYTDHPVDFLEAMIRAAGYEPDSIYMAVARAYCDEPVGPFSELELSCSGCAMKVVIPYLTTPPDLSGRVIRCQCGGVYLVPHPSGCTCLMCDPEVLH